MTRTKLLAPALGAALLLAPPALAQTSAPTPATAPDPSPAPSAAPPAAASETTSATITDAEVSSFAKAAIGVAKIRQDASVADADKQPKMVAAIESAGLTPARFNQIAGVFQSDPAFKERVQKAAPPADPAAAPAQPEQ